MARVIKNISGKTQEVDLERGGELTKVRAGWVVQCHPIIAFELLRTQPESWEPASRADLSQQEESR